MEDTKSQETVHLMVDLETWSTKPNALIIAIGAAFFDPCGEGVADAFYAAVSPGGQVELGRDLDPDTVLWWMQPAQRDALDRWLVEEKSCLVEALDGLHQWAQGYADGRKIALWGNGASFDNVILTSAMQRIGTPLITSHLGDRCHRTLKSLAPHIKPDRIGDHHNALDDVLYQVAQLQDVIKATGIKV